MPHGSLARRQSIPLAARTFIDTHHRSALLTTNLFFVTSPRRESPQKLFLSSNCYLSASLNGKFRMLRDAELLADGLGKAQITSVTHVLMLCGQKFITQYTKAFYPRTTSFKLYGLMFCVHLHIKNIVRKETK